MSLTKVKAFLWQVAEGMMRQEEILTMARCLKVSPVETGKLKEPIEETNKEQ